MNKLNNDESHKNINTRKANWKHSSVAYCAFDVTWLAILDLISKYTPNYVLETRVISILALSFDRVRNAKMHLHVLIHS